MTVLQRSSKTEKDKLPSKLFLYPFFICHMGMFGWAMFGIAYSNPTELLFIYGMGAFLVAIYFFFYLVMFDLDDIKWILTNSALGVLAIFTQMNWLMSYYGWHFEDYSLVVHVIPFTFFILYTFLLRQCVLDLFRARENGLKKRIVESGFVTVFIVLSLLISIPSIDLSKIRLIDSQQDRVVYAQMAKIRKEERSLLGMYKRSVSASYIGAQEATARALGDLYLKQGWPEKSWQYHQLAYAAAVKLESAKGHTLKPEEVARRLVLSSLGVMKSVCQSGEWDIAQQAMHVASNNLSKLSPTYKQQLNDQVNRAGEQLKKRGC